MRAHLTEAFMFPVCIEQPRKFKMWLSIRDAIRLRNDLDEIIQEHGRKHSRKHTKAPRCSKCGVADGYHYHHCPRN